MDKLEALFVRACKSACPERRIDRLYKMFYYGGRVDNAHIVVILRRICDNYNLLTTKGLIDDLNPSNAWKFVDDGHPYSYHELARAVLTSAIRLTGVSTFANYPLPARFKKDRTLFE